MKIENNELLKENINGMWYLLFYSLGSLPTPIIRNLGNTAWSFTSPDGSRVERYIVEFECRVRNMTFVEKYMSVSASGGTGRVATSVSCFGGLGQLYRVKVWAVSGPSISRQPAVKRLTPDGLYREEGGRQTYFINILDYLYSVYVMCMHRHSRCMPSAWVVSNSK